MQNKQRKETRYNSRDHNLGIKGFIIWIWNIWNVLHMNLYGSSLWIHWNANSKANGDECRIKTITKFAFYFHTYIMHTLINIFWGNYFHRKLHIFIIAIVDNIFRLKHENIYITVGRDSHLILGYNCSIWYFWIRR